MIKNLKSLFTDSEWDLDMCKVTGFACVVCGLVGFFLGKENTIAILGFGAGLLGWKAKVENV